MTQVRLSTSVTALTAEGYDESVSGDISGDPNNPLTLSLSEGTTRLSATSGGGDQEYVTVTVPEGFQLDSLVLESFSPNDVAFIGVQAGGAFTEPLDDSAIRENILGYTLFGSTRQIGTDILGAIGNGLNAQGFDAPLPSGVYTFALQQLGEDSDYTLAFNVSDEPQPIGPIVGITVDKTTVVEGEQFTFTFNVTGDIPPDGVTILVNDVVSAQNQVRSLTELDVANVQLTGIAGFPTPADGDSGFFVTITEPTATITVAAFDEGANEDEAQEQFTFAIIEGEAYEVDPNANSITLNIVDAADAITDPVVSVNLVGATFDSNDTLISPYLVENDGTPILSVVVTSDAPVPDQGLVVNINTNLIDLTQYIVGANFIPNAFGGEVLGAIYSDDGLATGLTVRMDTPNTVVNFIGLTKPTDGRFEDLTFFVEAAEGYQPSGESSTIRLYNSLEDVPPEPTVLPEIGISVTGQTTPLNEAGGTITINFTVNGDIPPNGVLVYVSTGEFAGIVDFDLLNTAVEGGVFPTPDGLAGGFYFKITEPNASLTVQARQDDVVEGVESINLSILDAAGYTIADGAREASILLRDDSNSKIQVSVEAADNVLIETEGALAVHTFNLSSLPAEGSLTVSVDAPGLTELDIFNFQIENGGISAIRPGGFDLLITGQSATVTLPVINDGVSEGLEEIFFSVLEHDDYQVDPLAGSASFKIVDTVDQVPGTDTESNDTIATAIATGLTADNNIISIDGAISFSFSNREVDQTEDVDMYSVDLAVGDVVRLDIDARLNRPSSESPDTILRLFDADGNQLAQSDDDFAPDELFGPGRQDSYLEYTATSVGTYYVGVSSFGNGEFGFTNDPYDPNVTGSGAGRSFGEYTLNLSLNESPTPQPTVIPPSTGEGPTVSLSATPATYDSDDNLLANALVQFVEDGSASVLTLGLEVNGSIPEAGLELILNSNIDLSRVFSTRTPFSPGGTEVLGAVYNDAGIPTGLRVKLISRNAIINLNLDNPEVSPGDGIETITFTLESSAGYTVGDDTISTSIYDTLADVPTIPNAPTVSLSISETALVESEGNLTTFTFTLDAPPPPEGVLIKVDTDVRGALGELDVFNAEISGGAFPAPNFRASGFFFRMTEQTATITLAAFDETTNPQIPAENALEGIEEFTFTIQPGVGYEIAPDASAVTLTIADNPDSVPLPDGDVNGGDSRSDILTETEFNDTIADAIATELSVDKPTYLVEGEIGTTRATRNLIDRSEDVDMYAFDLEAGQTLILDVDGGGSGEAGVEGSLLDSVLRIFDANGDEVARNDNGGAPDEIFQANGDTYLEFTAPETATYYAAISNLGNDFYDPNVAGSGSGWTFNDRFEPGPYRLTATLAGVLATDNDSVSTNNDTIANAQALDLTPDNPNLFVEAEFAQRFADRSNTIDATEDVDMFSVQLQAGDRITVDADSVRYDFEGFATGPGPDLRIFNETGEELVYVRIAGAPDEAFIADRDSYIDFTAPETGTYYIGASHYRNNSYNPNQVGSGSGAVFSPQFRVGPGPYTLAIALNPEGFNGEVFEEFTGDPPADAPVVSFAAVPGTFGQDDSGNDIVVSNQLIESEPGAVGILDFTFNVDGEIPEGGLEVLVKSDRDISTYFDGLDSNPRVAVGGEIIGGLYEANGGLIGFKALLTANNARFPYNAADERDDDPTAPETLTFSLANSPDYIASEAASASEVTFYDDLTQVQSGGGPVPEVGIAIDPTQLIESEGTEVTITVNATGDIPEDGLLVYIDGEEQFLGDFDVFNAEITGGAFPAPNGNASGFFFRIFENTATIKLQVFDETTNDQIPPEDALEGVENFSLSVQPNQAYTIDPNATTIDFTILDNPDSTPLPDGDGDGDGDGGDTDESVTDNDGRSTIDDTIETAVATGLTPNQTNVAVEGSIAVRWRNNPDQRADNTEDVDMFSFNLVAGESVSIDATSTPFELNGVTQVTAPTLRLFNPAGEELAIATSGADAASVSDPSLEFTATEDGTYYVGVSQFLNDNYDPLVNASGDGAQLVDQGISPGAYTLDLTLTTDRDPFPEVSLSIDPDVLSEEDTDPTVKFNFIVNGEIPEGGLSVLVNGSLNILDQVDGSIDIGFENAALGSFFDPTTNNFEIILLSDVGSITLPILNDVIQEEDADYTFTVLENDGSLDSSYVVNSAASADTFTLTDGKDGPGVGPTVGLSFSETELVEGNEFTINFNVDGDIPDNGLPVLVASPTPFVLGEFNIFDGNGDPAFTTSGIEGIPTVGDTTASSFLVTLTEPDASIIISTFDDGANEGVEAFSFSIVDGEIYQVAPDAGSLAFTINDFETVGTAEPDVMVGDDGDNSLAGLGDADIIAGGLGNDIILGGDGDDILRGSLNNPNTQDGAVSDDDIIFGGNGDDSIGGQSGNDILSGDEGNDLIWGDDGDDILVGVTGDDILAGDNFSNGGGSDLFVFGNGDGTDIVLDFEVGIDRIGLVEGELVFDDLTLTQDGGNTLLGVANSSEILAVLNNVQASTLDQNSFAIVPDVSNPGEALALI